MDTAQADQQIGASEPLKLIHQMAAASSGALLTSLLVTPLDVVKIRIQQQAHPFKKGTCFLYYNGLMDHLCTACANGKTKEPCEWFARPGNFTGTSDALFKISRTEGLRSLWSGLSPTLVMAVPATVLYYLVYDNMHARLTRTGSRESFLSPMIAGSSARLIATTVVSPLELLRTKMQSENLNYKDIRLAFQRSKAVDGWLSLWRGWSPTLIRDLPFSAIYWSGYERLKKNALQYFNRKETNLIISFVCGAFSGCLAAFITTPFDVVKTHRQITLGEVGDASRLLANQFTVMQNGAFSCRANGTAAIPVLGMNGKQSFARVKTHRTLGVISEICAKNGYRALFAGAVPRMVKVSLACAIMIGSYEYLKNFFQRL